MADKEDRGEGGQPTAGGSAWVKLSEFYPYGDGPPRLCAGINDSLTDASPTAVFAPTQKSKPQEKPSTGKNRTTEYAASMEAPQRDDVADPYQAEVVQEILDWIAYRLDLGASGAWVSQIAQMVEWAPNGGPEEGWAQAITEMFLGVTYSGPGQTYQLGQVLKRNASGALVAESGKPPNPEHWEPMIYRRIGRKQWRRKGDQFGLQAWDNPIPFAEDGDEPNTDPAISIGTACQHLSTYAVITRGIPIDAMGNASYPSVGLAASDQNWGMPIFGGAGYSSLPAGKSETLGGFRLPKPRPQPKAGDPEQPPKPEETVTYYLDVKNAIAAGFGPGCVAIYDPDRGTEKAPPQIYMTQYEKEKYGPDNVKIYGTYFKSRNSAEDVSSFGDKDADWTNKDRPIVEAQNDAGDEQDKIRKLEAKGKRTQADGMALAKAKAELENILRKSGTDKGPRMPVPYPGARQYDGSHIYAVLRKHPTKPMVQLLDVNLMDTGTAALAATGSDSILFKQHEGIVDGCARTKLYDPSNAFGGLGILPAHSVEQAQVDFLRTARPVGLGRVAITKRSKTPTSMARDDVLYVSRMMRLYGDDPSKNYTVARLLWSLRNTPGFTDVQVWWFVYAPRGLLAKAMWAHGARSMRLTDFVARYHDIHAGDVVLSIVLTNLEPPRAGHAAFYSRFRSRPDGGNTKTDFMPGPPPPALLRYVGADALGVPGGAKPVLAWNASYADPRIHVEEGQLPAIFQEGG